MGCHIEIPQDGPWKGTQVISCGEAFGPPKRCKFCNDTALYLCDWREVERVEDTHWHDVRVGDVWVLLATERGRVVDIEADEKGLFFNIDIGKGKIIRPFRFFNSTLTCPILRRGTCDQLMCERHTREVGDDVHYCMDCWQRQGLLIGASQ